jgi:hypothetical protein
VVLVIAQIRACEFNPFLYWATIVASTTFGTTMADFADRSLGIGYTGGSTLLFALLMISLGLWYWSEGTISVNTVSTPRVEAFYWAAITFSQTLSTALGDWLADTGGLGYEGGALVFAAGLTVIAALDQCFSGRAVLGSLYPDAAAGRRGRRFSRQTDQAGWDGAEPPARLGGDRGLYHRLFVGFQATAGKASGRRNASCGLASRVKTL